VRVTLRRAAGGVGARHPYPGVRFIKTVGVAHFESTTIDAALVDDDYDTWMKPAYHGDGSVKFAVQTKKNWRDTLVDETTKPTVSQQRDPDWSGYIWNNPAHPNYQSAIEIDNMAQADCVQQGKCKISINIGLAATGGTAPPAWTLAGATEDDRLAWEGAGAGANLTRLKYYKPEAVDYAEAFILALLERFDYPEFISSVSLNEYFPGSTQRPSDYTDTSYHEGYASLIDRLIATSLPRDGSGRHVCFYQGNPIERAGVMDTSTITAWRLGIDDSNAQFFEESGDEYRKQLHGIVPMSAALDAPPYNSNYQTTWQSAWAGASNPWGYTTGQLVTISTPLVAWFYGHSGPDSLDQEFIAKPGRPTDGMPGSESTTNLTAALDLFGPGGTWHGVGPGKWGGVPFSR
jgi:hypothetical protein